jgi:hypothetical protein
MQRLYQLRAVSHHPAIDRGVIHEDPTFPHEFFHMTHTQWMQDLLYIGGELPRLAKARRVP